jgi:hypothetical protein
MKIAICMPGEPRGLKYIHENLKHTFEKYFYDYTIFGFIPLGLDASCDFATYFPNAVVKLEKDNPIDVSGVPNGHELGFNPRKNSEGGAQMYAQQISGWKQSNLIRKEYEEQHGVVFDFIIRCRPDVRFTRYNAPDIKDMRKDTIYIPDFHHHEGWNDRFCIASNKVIDYYMNIIDIFHEDQSKACRAETFLKYAMLQSNERLQKDGQEGFRVEKVDIGFNRIRTDGTELKDS